MEQGDRVLVRSPLFRKKLKALTGTVGEVDSSGALGDGQLIVYLDRPYSSAHKGNALWTVPGDDIELL